jgi:hypothetical protein
MRIFIQYENHLLPMNIQLHDIIGGVYERILTEIGITADKIVNMFYDTSVIGQSPLDFAATVHEGKIRDGAFIFVILNHYPQLTEYTCKTYHTQFLQWKNRHLIPYDHTRLNYDPVLQSLNRRPTNQVSLPSLQPPTMQAPPSQSPRPAQQGPAVIPNVYFQNPSRALQSQSLISLASSSGSSNVSQVQRSPIRRSTVIPTSSQATPRPLLSLLANSQPPNSLATNLRLASQNPMSHAIQMRSISPEHAIRLASPRRGPISSVLTQSSPSRPAGLRPRSDIDSIFSSLTDRVLGVNQPSDIGYRIFSQLVDVPVTLTEEEFNRFQKKTYRQVCQDYRLQHPNETPYERCPIERELFESDELVVVLECGHYFKTESIRQWLTVSSHICPCCNADVRDTLPRTQSISNRPIGRISPMNWTNSPLAPRRSPIRQGVRERHGSIRRRSSSPVRRRTNTDESEESSPTHTSEEEDEDELESQSPQHAVRFSARGGQPHEQELMLDIFALLTQNPPAQSIDISQLIDSTLSSRLMSVDDAQTLINMMRLTLADVQSQGRALEPQVASSVPRLPTVLPPSNLPISTPIEQPSQSSASSPQTDMTTAPNPQSNSNGRSESSRP